MTCLGCDRKFCICPASVVAREKKAARVAAVVAPKPANALGCTCGGDELSLGHDADCPRSDYLNALDEGL